MHNQFQLRDIQIFSKVKLNQLDVFGQKNLIFKSDYSQMSHLKWLMQNERF